MNFEEILNIEKLVQSNEIGDFHKDIFNEYIESEKRVAKARENPFVYFYEDVIESTLTCNFQRALGEPIYKNATDDALCCLSICDVFYKIPSRKIMGWLQSALKFVDNIVLHYIQDCCHEIPKKYKNIGIEKSRYKQLSEKSDDEVRIVGSVLINLYDLRNDIEHRTITLPDGRQELIKPKHNKIRRTVVKNYPNVLRRILKIYTIHFKKYSIDTVD